MSEEPGWDWDSAQSFRLFLSFVAGLGAYVAGVRWLFRGRP